MSKKVNHLQRNLKRNSFSTEKSEPQKPNSKPWELHLLFGIILKYLSPRLCFSLLFFRVHSRLERDSYRRRPRSTQRERGKYESLDAPKTKALIRRMWREAGEIEFLLPAIDLHIYFLSERIHNITEFSVSALLSHVQFVVVWRSRKQPKIKRKEKKYLRNVVLLFMLIAIVFRYFEFLCETLKASRCTIIDKSKANKKKPKWIYDERSRRLLLNSENY